MEKEKTLDCLCIKSIDYKDNDKLVTLYAFGEGKITCSLKGVKKSKAKLKYAGALLCFGKYYLTGKNGFYSVIGCDLTDSFYGIWTDIDKYYPALCSLEILDKVADDREIGDKLAVLTLEFLNEICYKSKDNFISFAKYLNNVVNLLGYKLPLKCLNCGEINNDNFYYSYLKGGLLCGNCYDSTAKKLSMGSLTLLKCFEENKNIQATFDTDDILAVIQIYFDIIGKNLAKKFKTFEEYILFYNKVNIY